MFILSISSGLNYVAICSWRDGWGIDFAVIAAMFGLSLHMVIPARVSLQRGKGLQVSPSAWALFKVSAPELIWQRTTQGHRYVEAKFMGAYYCNNPCKISVPPTYRLHSTIQDSQISSNHIRLGVLNLVIDLIWLKLHHPGAILCKALVLHFPCGKRRQWRIPYMHLTAWSRIDTHHCSSHCIGHF